MQIEVTRRGGLAGVVVQGAVDTSELPAEFASAADAALRRLPYGRPPSAVPHPDSFQYQITVVEAGTRRTAALNESEVGDALQPVIEAAMARGHLG